KFSHIKTLITVVCTLDAFMNYISSQEDIEANKKTRNVPRVFSRLLVIRFTVTLLLVVSFTVSSALIAASLLASALTAFSVKFLVLWSAFIVLAATLRFFHADRLNG